MFFWSEFAIKSAAQSAQRYAEMNAARDAEDGATYDGKILEVAFRLASTTEPHLLASVALELADLATEVGGAALAIAAETEEVKEPKAPKGKGADEGE